jgi:hypothetical protein
LSILDATQRVVSQAVSMAKEECQGALTRKQMLWGGGALQLLEHAVLLDAARDDDGGGNAEPLAREVDLLGRLSALELVDRKRVTVDTATSRGEA